MDFAHLVQHALKRAVREPLLHFVVLGCLLFAAYGYLNRANRAGEIVVSATQVGSLNEQFRGLWQRKPSPQESDALVESYIREEVLFREGLAIGLNRDDPVIRRRIAQKMMFLGQGTAPSIPNDNDLQVWLDAHADSYRTEPRFGFEQIFLNDSKHPAELEARVNAIRNALRGVAVGAEEPPRAVGDPTMLRAHVNDATSSEISNEFGMTFLEGIAKLPPDQWMGPIRSAYGLHFVRLTDRQESRVATLAEVRAEVQRDWLDEQSRQADEAFYQTLRHRYAIHIEQPFGSLMSVRGLAALP